MSEIRIQTDCTDWFILGVFFASLIFGTLYAKFFDWRKSVTGRATVTLHFCIAGTLLHSALILLGLQTIRIASSNKNVTEGGLNQFLTWVSVVCLGGTFVAIVIFAWQLTRLIVAEDPPDQKWLWRLLRLGRFRTGK